MVVLAIETSTDQLGVAVVNEQRVLAAYEVLADRPHATELPGAVTRVLKAADLELAGIDALVVDVGPGSFTGLRIGLSFVKALSFTSKKPVVGIPSLDVLASNVLWAGQLVCPVLDAKQKKVYAALYRTADGRLKKASDYTLATLDEFKTLLKSEPTIFLGDGAALYRDRLTEWLGAKALVAAPELWLPRAGALGRLGLERLARGEKDDPSTLVPMYLHPLTCTIRPELQEELAKRAAARL